MEMKLRKFKFTLKDNQTPWNGFNFSAKFAKLDK